MPELKLHDTEYGRLVQQLGDLPVFKSDSSFFGHWFTTKEEARTKALDWKTSEFERYKRNCPGKEDAAKAIATLSKQEAQL